MNTHSPFSSQDLKTELNILVVEDNHDTREMICELLCLLGYQPVGVASAEQALSEVASRGFGMLFTDISLPGMSGIELAKSIATRHPALRIILASGYHVEKKDIEGFDCEILVKPYDLEQLQTALQGRGKSA